jgi:hypothetical protein
MGNAQFISVILPNENIGAASGDIAPGIGHAAFILVSSTGAATFYEYGTWANGTAGVVTTNPLGGNNGSVREVQITSGTIQFDSSGNVEQASLQSALNQVFGAGGLYAGQDPGAVFATPFSLNSAQYSNIGSGISSFIASVNAGGTDAHYSTTGVSGGPNCINFDYDMANAANGQNNAGVLTISTTQNNFGVSIPTAAVDGIVAQADTLGTPTYQYLSPYSWDATSGQSSISQVSSALTTTSIEDFAVQFEQALENINTATANLVSGAGTWNSGEVTTNGAGLPEWILGSSSGDTITATLNGTQSPVSTEFSNSSGTPVAQLNFNADGSNTLNGYNSSGTLQFGQTDSAGSNGQIAASITGTGDATDLSDASISLAASAQAALDGANNAVTLASNAALTLAGSGNTVTDTTSGGDSITTDASNSFNVNYSTIDVTASGCTDGIHCQGDTINAVASDVINLDSTDGGSDAVNMANGTVNIGSDSSASVTGGSDLVTSAGDGTISLSGGNGMYTVDDSAGDTVSAASTGSGYDIFNMANGTANLANGAIVGVYGGSDLVNAASGATAVVTGALTTVDAASGDTVDASSTGTGYDVINLASGTANLGNGAVAQVTGGSDLVTTGTDSTAIVSGGLDTVDAGSGSTVDAGSTGTGYDNISLSSGTVSLTSGAVGNISGGSDLVDVASGDTATVSGGSQYTVDVSGSNAAVTVAGTGSSGWDTVNIANGTATIDSGANSNVNDGSDLVVVDATSQGVVGNGGLTTIDAANGDAISVSGTNGQYDVANITSGTVAAANGTVTDVYGNYDTITASNAVITLGADQTHITIDGSGDTIDAGDYDGITTNGNNDSTYGSYDVVFGEGTGDDTFGEGDTDDGDEDDGGDGDDGLVVRSAGSTTGNSTGKSNAAITLSSGESSNVTGSSNNVTVGNTDSVSLSGGSSLNTVTMSGSGSTVTDNGLYNSITVSGSSDSVNISGNAGAAAAALEGAIVTFSGTSEEITFVGGNTVTAASGVHVTVTGADGTLTASNTAAGPENVINWKAGGSEVQSFTNSASGVSEDDTGYAGSNGTGTVVYSQVITTPASGAVSSAVSGKGDVSGLESASITLENAASATLTGNDDAVTLGNGDSLALSGVGGDRVTLSGNGTTVSDNAASSGNMYTLSGSNNTASLLGGDNTVSIGGASDTVDVLGNAGEGLAEISGTNALLEFAGASAETVNFNSGATGTLKLESPSGFSGTVAGLADGDSIDLSGFLFSGKASISSITGSGAVGTATDITITDGSAHVMLALLNQYANQFAVNASAYTLTADGSAANAGTLFQLAAAH